MSGVTGDLVSLAEGQVLLPSFVTTRPDGVWVDVSALDSPELFLRFVERVFGAGARFAGLDYDLFRNLLFDYSPSDISDLLERSEKAGKPPVMRLADDIVAFPPERQALYRGAKILGDGEAVEYLFEQLSRDVETQVPRFDEEAAPDEAGVRPILGYDTQTVAERVYLDFDEFVAALWSKDIRYGIDAAAVREAIRRDKVERLSIAHSKPPQPGNDASIAEQTDALHRDDSPRILPDGRMDLRHFRNRFPQVTEGTRLFKKMPRQSGAPGWNTMGKELAPEEVKDFDISTLAGPGTRIVRGDDGNEYVVAAMDGFLDIDAKTSQLSINDKIVHREGVSARGTGDLALSGDEFEEHGEVQEQRVVEGLHMTFLADIFGNIVSNGGRVLIKQKISGGSAKSPGGSITVEGAALSATLEANPGSIEVAQAEGSLLIGQKVHVTRAVSCDIIADEVVIEVAEGCAIAARNLTIGEAKARKNVGTTVTLLLPDIHHYETQIEAINAERKAAEDTLAVNKEAQGQLTVQPDIKAYLSLQPKIKSGALVMTPEQEANWQKLLVRVGPTLREYAGISGKAKSLQQTIDEASERIGVLQQERVAAMSMVRCEIRAADEETLVRARMIAVDAPPLASLPIKELRKNLREAEAGDERIRSSGDGYLWPPEKKSDLATQ